MTIVLGVLGPIHARWAARGCCWASRASAQHAGHVERVQASIRGAENRSRRDRSARCHRPTRCEPAWGEPPVGALQPPAMRGRVIFGGGGPWNQVWRTGANQATVLETSADLTVAGTRCRRASTGRWTIPSPAG